MSVESLYRVNLTGTGQTINGTGSYTTPTIDLRTVDQIEALLIRVASVAGTPDVRVQYQATPDGVTWIDPGDSPDIISSTAVLFAAKDAPEGWQSVEWAFTKSPSKQIRLVFTGINANPADTVLDAKLLMREKH